MVFCIWSVNFLCKGFFCPNASRSTLWKVPIPLQISEGSFLRNHVIFLQFSSTEPVQNAAKCYLKVMMSLWILYGNTNFWSTAWIRLHATLYQFWI